VSAEASGELKCPYCGATINVPEGIGSAYVTCPYCGYTFHKESREALGEHYALPATVASSEAFDAVLDYITLRYTTPKDLNRKATLESANLVIYPIYELAVEAAGECTHDDLPNDMRVVEEFFLKHVPAGPNEAVNKLLSELYTPPSVGREPFKPTPSGEGRYAPLTLGMEEALRMAQASGKAVVGVTLSDECREGKINLREVKAEFRALIHAPIWVMKYRYARKEWPAVVDASNATVIYAEAPIRAAARAFNAAVAAATIASGAVAGAIVDLYIYPTTELVGPFIGAGIGALIALQPLKNLLRKKEVITEYKF